MKLKLFPEILVFDMKLIIQNTQELKGVVTIPGSKSHSIRGLFLGLLATGESRLLNSLVSQDTHDAIRVCKTLGAEITQIGNQIHMKSSGVFLQEKSSIILTGNSGLTTHFVLPILGLRANPHQKIIVDCHEQMRKRPISAFLQTLSQLGLTIRYLKQKNALPIEISGRLRGGKVTVEGFTSQYLSALLMALPCATEDSELIIDHLQERPYVEMTLEWLRRHKIIYSHEKRGDVDIYFIKGGQRYNSFNTEITGDFSSAANVIAAAVLTNSVVEIQGMNIEDAQGDKALVNILQEMGADINVLPNKILIRGGEKLRGLEIDGQHIPDLLPILAVIGTQTESKLTIRNVKHARIKETDRIHSLSFGLKQLGAMLKEHEDGMTIYPSDLQGGNVKGYGDHRTVMALSVAGLLATGITTIDEGEAIQKTFPDYHKMMQSLGAKMEMQNDI